MLSGVAGRESRGASADGGRPSSDGDHTWRGTGLDTVSSSVKQQIMGAYITPEAATGMRLVVSLYQNEPRTALIINVGQPTDLPIIHVCG